MGACQRWWTIFESEVQIKLIMERLIKLLKANKDIADYRISEEKVHSYQLFFVKNKLETNRLSDSDKIKVTVYVDMEKKARGSGDFEYAE